MVRYATPLSSHYGVSKSKRRTCPEFLLPSKCYCIKLKLRQKKSIRRPQLMQAFIDVKNVQRKRKPDTFVGAIR